MRRNQGTLNGQLARILSETGHTDQIVVTDAGLPIPRGVERVDLALRQGIPSFLEVLDATLDEIVVEGALVSEEIREASPALLAELESRFDELDITIEMVPHLEFKRRTADARAAVRSGEFTPYANVILTAGVAY